VSELERIARRRLGPAPRRIGPARRALSLAPAFLFAALVAWRMVAVASAAAPPERRPTPLFEDSEGGFLSDGEAVYGELGFWALPEPIPAKIRATAIAVEDRRFELHPGVDPIGIARAVAHNLQGRQEGGSTIAMQAIRLAHPRSRSLFAKLEESAAALAATAAYGREAMLRRYLELLPQGGNMYGVAYSARRCFRKPVQDLSWAECALLMAVPQDPRNRALFDFEGSGRARARARVILAQLFDQGIIGEEDREAALYELDGKADLSRERRPDDSYHYILRVIDEYAKRPAAAIARPLRATLDPRIQDLAARLALKAMPEYRRLGADNMAVMVADARRGEVLAYVGSAAYFDEEHKGSIDYCRLPRSSGSTLKPFFYALGLETGAFGPGSILADLPLRMKDRGGEYSLTDFDDSYLGPMLYRDALGNSRNVPAIKVLEGVGLEECYSFLGRLGLHDYERGADYYGYGMAVGGIYTSLDRLVAAYACLANDGRSLGLRWFRDEPSEPPSALLSESSARMVGLFLSDTEARLPSFASTALTHFPFPVAVKTGSSNGFRDAWAIGYSRRYVAGLWIGHSDFLRMNHVAGSTAAALLLELFKGLQPEAARNVGEEPFPPPRGWSSARICAASGLIATANCPRAAVEYFAPGAEPRESCAVHRRVLVDSSTGDEATAATPESRRALRVVTSLGPEYAAFSLARGYGIPGSDPSGLIAASVSLTSPVDGSRIVVDPEIPPRFQTLALRASVSPAVPEIVWFVDGREFARVSFPYEARWPISPGEHSIRAAFPRAFVESRTVSVRVLAN
jgi:penicillin-binding protein 1C